MTTTGTFRKKFGRGYVLDLSAFQDEMSSYISTPPDDSRRHNTTTVAGSSGSSSSSSNWIQGDVGTSSGKVSPDSGIAVDSSCSERSRRTSLDDTTKGEMGTESSAMEYSMEELPKPMKRMMSVSRTGRCKRKDRQRASVLDTTNFYGAKNNNTTTDDVITGIAIGDDVTGGSPAGNEAENMPASQSPKLEFSVFDADSDLLREYSDILPDYFNF